ncbi:MAG: HEAT repeat domain-containing protein [Desulfurivibrionaceae bacterium]|nr:HEAT repeat domain-containing protein [Desulfurivibrionaceae bacterium]
MQDAKQLINIFLLAWKNYGLYPEDHTSTLKAFENLVAAFDNFFSTHGDLRLTVEKDRLLCGSEPIHIISPDAPAEELITLLYRDGIKWIEFQEGLTLDEVAAFFRIANKYRSFAEETEGDIVTALMDEELEYIDFKAVDIFWQDLLLMDFAQLPPPAPRQEEVAGQEEGAGQNVPDRSGPDRENPYARSIADPSLSAAQLELSNGDYRVLQQMVEEEESWEITEDLIELLLIILKNQTGRDKFTAVLEFISELAVESIGRDKFALLVKLLQELHQLSGPETSSEEDWRSTCIARFFQDLSRPEIFQLFRDNLLKLHASEIEKLKALERTLHYFSPRVIPFLVPVLMRNRSAGIQQMVSEVIADLSRRDLAPLEKIADRHGAEMGEELLLILNRLQGDRVNEILFKMCNHSSDRVRRKAIEELLDRDPKYAQRLFALIDDPSQGIRTSLLAAFAKHRSGALETLLLNYLKDNFGQEDPGHILACYKALGRCGSDRAVPFLGGVLLGRGWNSFIGSGKLIFREGAAVALALLDTPAAKDVLRKAAKSRFKVIRIALAGARTITASGETPR